MDNDPRSLEIPTASMFGANFNGREEGRDEDSSSSDRRITRSQSNPPPTSHLDVPSIPTSKPLGARRPPSPNPSSVDSQFSQFSFPATQTAMSTSAQTQEEQMQAMVAAATQAALAALQSTGSHKRKPELPNFDANNVEIWIRRVESAFIRANISSPTDKFAYLETKFSVDQDPKVNEFLFGDPSKSQWRAFLSYLRHRYGKSVKAQCTAMLRGFQRDGRRPSDMLAYIRQETSKVTIDDLQKEMILSSLPQDVQWGMADRVKIMTADEAAALADNYFDKDGKILHPSTPSAISSVDSKEEKEQEESDVNAIGGRRQGRRPFKKPSTSKGQQLTPVRQANFTPAFSSVLSSSASAAASSKAQGAPPLPTCRHHVRYGSKAYTCEVGCHLYPGKGKQGNANAGTRS